MAPRSRRSARPRRAGRGHGHVGAQVDRVEPKQRAGHGPRCHLLVFPEAVRSPRRPRAGSGGPLPAGLGQARAKRQVAPVYATTAFHLAGRRLSNDRSPPWTETISGTASAPVHPAHDGIARGRGSARKCACTTIEAATRRPARPARGPADRRGPPCPRSRTRPGAAAPRSARTRTGMPSSTVGRGTPRAPRAHSRTAGGAAAATHRAAATAARGPTPAPPPRAPAPQAPADEPVASTDRERMQQLAAGCTTTATRSGRRPSTERADRIIVMKDGRVQDDGSVSDVLDSPSSSYTRRLLEHAPSLNAGSSGWSVGRARRRLQPPSPPST